MLQNHHFCTIIIVTVICTSNGLAENALINPHINLVGIMMVIFPGGGGRGTPYNGPYGEAPPERGTFFTLQVYERVRISRVEVYERVSKSFI